MDPFVGLDVAADTMAEFVRSAPFGLDVTRHHVTPLIDVPSRFEKPAGHKISTQDGFGRLLSNIAREHSDFASRIVTTSPDVTVSTNLGSWVNRRGIFGSPSANAAVPDAQVASPQKWTVSRDGQHIELGIAENNLFILLGALGLSGPLHGGRLLPIGTVYDPFISRGLDALNYACYQDARFILVATPSGLTLAPEGGAHQSVITPLIGIGQPSLTSFEPAYIDELCEILRWSFEHLQADDGGPVYLRLSTRPLDQPEREMTPDLSHQILEGGYWLVEPAADAEIALVVSGPPVQEVMSARQALSDDLSGLGVLVITSPNRLQRGWIGVTPRRCHRQFSRRSSPGEGPCNRGPRYFARRSLRRALVARRRPKSSCRAIRCGAIRTIGKYFRTLWSVRPG